jgi:hypothetical protein
MYFLRAFVAYLLFWSAALAQVGQIPAFPPVQPAPGGGGYTGPGDIVSGALAWHGLRCYSTAYTGNIADIWDAATGSTTETVLGCNAGGAIVVKSGSALATTCASGCKDKTLYDQSGQTNCGIAACDLTQSTNASRPTFTQNCIGSLPCLTFAGSQSLQSASTFSSTNQPYTISAVLERTGSFTTQMSVYGDIACNGIFFTSTANTVGMFAQSSVVSATATDSAAHAGQFVFNGASSSIKVDGTTTNPGNPGTNLLGSGALEMGSGCGGTVGNVYEAGAWSGAFSSGQQTSMNANQHSYWGF